MPKTVLLTIDMQKEYFVDGRPLKVPEGPAVLANIVRLQDGARKANIPLIHIQHLSLDPEGGVFVEGSPFSDLVDESAPDTGEKVIIKRYPSAFAGTDLEGHLQALGVDTLIIAGLMSFMCCDTTAREAHSRGYKVLFVKDAAAAIDLGEIPAEQVHEVTLAVQGFIFSEVVSTEEALGRLTNGKATGHGDTVTR
jgi:nicotinamidase-related amidase